MQMDRMTQRQRSKDKYIEQMERRKLVARDCQLCSLQIYITLYLTNENQVFLRTEK